MKPVFLPYKMKSSSAKVLAQAFNSERVNVEGKFKNNYCRPIINWGNSQVPEWLNKWPNQLILNHPNAVKIAANKLLTFEKFIEAGVKHPVWTTSIEEVKQSFIEDCFWVARKTLTGKAGEGITLIHSPNDIVVAPLYTKYFKKKYEYRIHVVNGKMIDFSLKKKRQGVDADYKIRNVGGGWVFCREGVVVPKRVEEEATKAVQALGLFFGAVDVGYNEHYDEACVFEVNTAPGLQGVTIQNYAQALQKVLDII